MKAYTIEQAHAALCAAKSAVRADAKGDTTARDRAISDLWNAVGYWMQPRGTAEFRGDAVPPKMIRLPNGGRAVSWDRRWKAVAAWALA